MRILIGCESSGVVRRAFRERGHDAWSCDLLPSDDDSPFHIQADVLNVLDEAWGMIVAFPPCTHLAASGAPSWAAKQADGRQQAAIDFVLRIYNSKCPRIAIENPTGILSRAWRKPDQIIHPYYFGEPFMKRTCLWLKNLPRLVWIRESTMFETATLVKPEFHYTSNSYHGGKLKDGTRRISKLPIYKSWDSSKERSKSFNGIGKAMAEQWG